MDTNFLSANKLRKAAVGVVAGTADVESAIIDMQGFLSCTFFAQIATANAGNYIKVQEGDEPAMGDAADLLGSKVVSAGVAGIVAVEIRRPCKRYLKAIIVSGASTAVGDMYVVQSLPAVLPVTNNVTDVITSEAHISPAEGTA